MTIDIGLASLLGVALAPLYVHVCAKIAARAWFAEQRRYQNRFLTDIQKDTMHHGN